MACVITLWSCGVGVVSAAFGRASTGILTTYSVAPSDSPACRTMYAMIVPLFVSRLSGIRTPFAPPIWGIASPDAPWRAKCTS